LKRNSLDIYLTNSFQNRNIYKGGLRLNTMTKITEKKHEIREAITLIDETLEYPVTSKKSWDEIVHDLYKRLGDSYCPLCGEYLNKDEEERSKD